MSYGRGEFATIRALLNPLIFQSASRQNGLDSFLYLRFLKMMLWIFVPIAFFSWTILLPIYGTSRGANTGLNQFTCEGQIPTVRCQRNGLTQILLS